MKIWLERNAKALQALGALVTMVAAVAALIGVKVQIDASARQQREQSARDIYREYLNLSIAKPELADPDYCAIKGTPNESAYEDYVDYLLYTSEQVLAALPDWQPTINERLLPHREYLCATKGMIDDTPEVEVLLDRFRAKYCKSATPPCP